MTKKAIFLAALLISGISFGQDYKSGDAELDANLKIINTDANKDLAAFKLNLTKTFNVTLPRVEACFKVGMNAGDALMAFEISNITRKPIEDVITVYKKSKSKGWGAMAKELGIKPGSAEFHALKGKAKEKSKGKPVGTGNAKPKGNSGGSANGKPNGNGKPHGSSGKPNGKGQVHGKK